MNDATKDFINQWIAKANEDLLVVNKLTELEFIAKSTVCFHCQQAVEKFLKAFLIANQIEIRKTHNIEFLLSECGDIDGIFTEIDTKNLNDFGVDIRYPGDMYTPTNEETLEYKEIAFRIKEIVEERINNILKN